MRPRKKNRYHGLMAEGSYRRFNSLTPPKPIENMSASIDLSTEKDGLSRRNKSIKRKAKEVEPYRTLSPIHLHEAFKDKAVRKLPVRRLRASGEKDTTG